MNSLANVWGDLYTYSNNDESGKSLIDFIFVSKNLVNNILFARILDSGINLSDHRPVFCKLFYYDLVLPVVSKAVPNVITDKGPTSSILRWDKGNLSLYYGLSRLNLLNVMGNESINATPAELAKCVDSTTIIESMYSQIVDALLTSDRIIPRASASLFKFWWNEHLDQLKERALTKFRVWESLGKPRGDAAW